MRAFAAIGLALLAGCATTPGENRLAERDPLEGFNRGMWAVNRGVDQVVVKPVSTVYRTVTPRPARRGLSRVIANLGEPFSAINNLLQGKPSRAADNIGRFLVNTTIGVGGLADHATGLGIKPAPEDFGQTLAVWGVNGGPYLVLPLLGPSTLRDGVGTGVGFAADPYQIGLRESGLTRTQRWGVTGATVISARADLTESGADKLLDTSLDPYATARSAFLQRRRVQILNQEGDDGSTGIQATGEDDAIVPTEEDAIVPTEADSQPAPPATPETPAETPAPQP